MRIHNEQSRKTTLTGGGIRRIPAIIFFVLGVMALPLETAASSASDPVKAAFSQDGSRVDICNGIVKASFCSKGTFNIISMNLNGRESVNEGANAAPWKLTYRGPEGQCPEIDPSCTEFLGCREEKIDDGRRLVFSWKPCLDYKPSSHPLIVMYVTLREGSDRLEWNLDASFPENWVITDFQFPTIALISPEKAKVITPAGWGNEYELKAGGHYEANYPSWSASMQMMMLDDGEGAFYYSPEDHDACGKLMTIDQSWSNCRFSTKVSASEGWSNEGEFSVPWTTWLGFHPEGWASAATHWYRPFALSTEWGSKTLEERNIPDWMLHKDLWIRIRHDIDSLTRPTLDKTLDYFGENLAFHWYFWHRHPYDSHYPDYLPAHEDFAKHVAYLRSRNCQVMPYINGRLWDPSTESYDARKGFDASCRRPDGNLYTEIYPTSKVPNTVACPASEEWHDMIMELADSIQNNYGTNGLYIDQIAAAAPYPCFAKNHGHAPGGGEFWFHAYRDMMKDLRKDHLKPGNVVFSEENAECYIPSFDILLTVNTPHSPTCKIVPLYPLIYSDRVITCAYTYTPYEDVTRGDFRYQNMQCLLYGSQLGWVNQRLLWIDEKSELEASFLKTLARFRSHQHDVFIGGRYVREFVPEGDNEEVDIPVFGRDYVVKGSEWVSPSGQKVWYVVNSSDRARKIVLPDGRRRNIPAMTPIRIDL